MILLVFQVLEDKSQRLVSIDLRQIESVRSAADGTIWITMSSGREIIAANSLSSTTYLNLVEAWKRAIEPRLFIWR